MKDDVADERDEKEMIDLDATVVRMISVTAFEAELANGHRLVAHGAHGAPAWNGQPGNRIRVRMSPFNMGQGRLVG